MKTKLYPLKFKPILKEKVWGGEKLESLLQKNSPSINTGESWEISAIPNSVSIVENGELAGQNLLDILKVYREELVGSQVYRDFGDKFPLLFKFIDAGENLSLQLHPDDELAQKRHDSFGKSEMWYIVQADQDAGIYVGFKKGTTREDYLTHLENGNLEEIMNFERVNPGDVFYIKPGLVHSIGKGVCLAEIQQSSDVTYRLYDWNRKDLDGKPRKLHTEMALDAIDFEFDEFKITYDCQENVFKNLVDTSFFKTEIVCLTSEMAKDYTNTDSFVVLMCVKGEVKLKATSLNLKMKMGETILIPASLKQIQLSTTTQAELLQITI